MINFKDIQALYPNAYAALVKYCYPHSNYAPNCLIEVTNDKLYEFFDSNGIFCAVTPIYTSSATLKKLQIPLSEAINKFSFKIADREYKDTIRSAYEYSTRNLCTTKMFEKACEQLELKLKK